MELALVVVCVALVVALLLVSGRFAVYRTVYRYSEDDVADERRKAARHSRTVLDGKASEQLVALLPEFCDRFNAGDARFVGAPVDYVIFDGLERGELERVVLLEVKTGSSRLNGNERAVKRAVEEGRVSFEMLRVGARRHDVRCERA